jgi:two-component system response regulator PilR (NtrC family)
MAEILLVEDELNAREILSLGLEGRGHSVEACAGPDEAEQALELRGFDIVLTDLRMDGRDAGIDVVRMAARLCPMAKVLLLTAYASAETAVEVMKEGAFDYLTKPVSSEELGLAVERALASDSQSSAGSRAASKDEVLIGDSQVMHRVRDRLLRASSKDFTVLITGESGTGKELAARFVHNHSPRGRGPFIPVHCGAIPEGLFESELFGHCKGAFTGAEADRAGLIDSADGGTLFLDEVGEMPLRQRREDIPELVTSLLNHWGGSEARVSDSCMQRLCELPLLGNVRELENLLQRLLALSENDSLEESLLDDFYPEAGTDALTLNELQHQGMSLDQALEGVERQLLTEALHESKGNATKAAGLLGISFRSIRYRLEKLGLKDSDR